MAKHSRRLNEINDLMGGCREEIEKIRDILSVEGTSVIESDRQLYLAQIREQKRLLAKLSSEKEKLKKRNK